MSSSHDNGAQTPQAQSMSHQHQAAVAAATTAASVSSAYAGMMPSSGPVQYSGNMPSGQLGQFGDTTMEVAAAAIGMDFAGISHASPLSATPMSMIPSVNGTPSAGRKRKASAMNTPQGDSDSIAELKLMTTNNMAVPLSDLAIRVREEENGSSAEKFRQTFAMAWLKKNCELSPDASVPRNRIYARYVELCAEYSLKPLNPASFGKLVRVAYPGIKTRRLGVRGQSKYHYCGFRLIGEQNNATGNTPTGTPGRFGNSPDRYVIVLHIEVC